MGEVSLVEMKEKQKSLELKRRIPIKLSTAALISVIGPASAWAVGEYNGLLIYILVYIISKLMTAQIASISVKNAIFAYRFSPWLLVAGGLAPLISEDVNVYVLLIPFLLGSYEGAYWTGYHDIRRVFKNKDETENKSVMVFTRVEVFCTVIGALVAAYLKSIESNSLLSDPGVIAGCFALTAFVIPWNKQIVDPDVLKFGKITDNDSLAKGKLISQPFAVVQFVATNGMRFVALQKSVMWLGILVAVAEAAGHIASEIVEAWNSIKKRLAAIETKLKIVQTSISKQSIKMTLWNSGYYVAFCGLVAMTFGLYVDEFWYFIVGWFFAQGALRGVLRRLELVFANEALKVKDTSVAISNEQLQIGLRERLKFKAHAVMVVLLVLPCIYLSSNNLVFLLLAIGSVSCVLSLLLPKRRPEYFEEEDERVDFKFKECICSN